MGFCMAHSIAQIHCCHRDLGRFRGVCGESLGGSTRDTLLARGAEAWRTGDWWTVVLSYLEALTIDPALKALWERVTIAIRQLKDSGDDGKATEPEALRLACLKAAEGEISVDWLLFYTEAIELLPVDINWHRQCNEAAHKARDLLTAYGHNQTKDTNEQER